MAIITVTAQANEKNTRTVSTAKGDKKIISVPLFEKEKGSSVKVAYGSAFLPDFIQLGDTVTVSGRVQAKESGEYVNYNFVFLQLKKYSLLMEIVHKHKLNKTYLETLNRLKLTRKIYLSNGKLVICTQQKKKSKLSTSLIK